jgi:hypothetical protein
MLPLDVHGYAFSCGVMAKFFIVERRGDICLSMARVCM